MSVIKKSFIKIASLMLGVTLVATACDFGQSSSNSEISQSSSSEVSTQTSLPSSSSDISSSSSSSNNSTSSISSSTSSTSSSIIPTVTGISLNTDNVKKDYNYGDTLNLAGLVVTANYSNNTTTEVTNYTTNIANGSELKTVGENDIVVTYLTFTASFKITVNKVLTGIELNTEAVKKEYGYNEALNLTGLVVTAKYNDNSEATVTEYTTNPENGTVLTNLGENTVTVAYQEKTASFKVNVVKVLTGIELNTANVKKVYDYNDALDLTGLVVTAKYNNNTEETVTDYVTDPANGTALQTIGENTITVTYQGKTAEFKINVIKKLVGIELNTSNVKKEFTEGDAFEATGLVVTANYNDGSNETVTDYVTDPTRGTILNNVGTVTVKVTYQGFTKNYEIKVNEALVEEKGTELLLDLGVQPEFENNVANVSARGTTPKSDYFVNFKLTRNSQDAQSMTIVNSKLRVMEGDIIENTESLHGVTAIRVNGGNGNFRLYAGYTATEMYEFLEAESQSGDRVYNNVPNVNYIKLVGKYDNWPADILSIEFTYTRDNENKPVDGVKTTVSFAEEQQGYFVKGDNTIEIYANTVVLDGSQGYNFTGITYNNGYLLFVNARGHLILLQIVDANRVQVIDCADRYSSTSGEYVRVLSTSEITLKIDGVVVPFNTKDTRREMKIGESFTASATSNAVPEVNVNLSIEDETAGEINPYAGKYTANSDFIVQDYMNNEEHGVAIGDITVTYDGNYHMELFILPFGDYFPGCSGTFEASFDDGEITVNEGNLILKLNTNTETIEFNYTDYDTYQYFIEGDVGYDYVPERQGTASIKNGVVTALNEGDFTLVAMSDDDFELRYYVHVNSYVAARITVDTTPVTMKTGETHQINATVNEDATDKTLLYDSSDKTVLTVSETGLVTAIKEGTAKVTITSNDEEVEIEFTVEKGVSKITVTTYKLVDDNTDEHTIVVKEGISAKIDDTYNFTFNNGAYVYDEDNSVSFKIVVSGSTTSLDITDDEMAFFGYNDGPIYLFDIWNYVDIEFVSSEQIVEGGEQGQGQGGEGEQGQGGEQTQDVVVSYTFVDEGGSEHTLAVVEGKEATIDGAYHFTFENGHYYFDDDDTCYFDIRHSGSDLLDFYNEGMSFYTNGIAEFYSDEGTVDLTVVD